MASRIVLLLISFVAFGVRVSAAQNSIKHAIFEDCDKASKEFSAQTVEQQISLSDFLARVVALSTQSPTAPEVFAPAPGVPAGGETSGLTAPKGQDLVTGALWHNLDAKRELKAKRCALELLKSAGGMALHVLPTLASTYSEQSLSDEIAVGLEETVADVAERAHKQNILPSEGDFVALTPLLFGQRPLVARIVVQEFISQALPYVLRTVASLPRNPTALSSFLDEADPSGALAMRALIEIVPSLTPEQSSALVPQVPLPKKDALTPFINDFIKLAASPANGGEFLKFLGDACLLLGGFTVDADQQVNVRSLPGLTTPGALTPAQSGCIISSVPSAAKELVNLLTRERSPEQQLLALAVLRVRYQSLPKDIREDLCSNARERAFELGPSVMESALDALKLCTEQYAETIHMSLSLFKELGSVVDLSKGESLQASLIELLSVTGLGKEPNRFAPYIKQALGNPMPSQNVLQLAVQIPQLQSDLFKRALEVPPSSASLAALQAIHIRKAFPKSSNQALIDLLRYPEVQSLGEDTLRTLGASAVTPLRKSASRAQWSGKASALSALVGLGAATKSEISELGLRLATQEGCSFVTSHTGTMCTIIQGPGRDLTIHNHVASAVQRCINEFSSDQLVALSTCDSSLVMGAADTVAASVASSGDSARLAPIVKLLAQTQLSTPAQQNLARVLLDRGSQQTLELLLPAIGSLTSPPREVLQAVNDVAERNRDTKSVFLAALKVLALHAYEEYDWTPFIKDALRVAGKGIIEPDVLEVIAIAPSQAVLAQVMPALESDTHEKLVGASLIGAALASKAVPIVSRLWHLRQNRTPLIRYTATLALLQINPLTPEVQEEVRHLLVNRYYQMAVQLPIKWPDTVAIVDMDRSAFGDLRKRHLERLIRPAR